MLPDERRQQILSLLQKQGRVTINELSQRFQVSQMTVHRDLDHLDDAGLLRKVRGGAVPSAPMESTAVRPGAGRCLICYKKPRRQTQVMLHLADGRQRRTCCAHCALMVLAREEAGVSVMLVTGFLYGRTLPAAAAHYLVHPDVAICCVPTILAFEQCPDARRFQTGFGGEIYGLAGATAYLREEMKLGNEENLPRKRTERREK